jgi:hypothetical protein
LAKSASNNEQLGLDSPPAAMAAWATLHHNLSNADGSAVATMSAASAASA